ncbi:TonB-dependent receptor [Chitinophaga niabensis]|uniref:TonB-dependent receptor n=1 Tax=Chitinophaga niabensis TaxID=536979 RepID=UPI0031BA3671
MQKHCLLKTESAKRLHYTSAGLLAIFLLLAALPKAYSQKHTLTISVMDSTQSPVRNATLKINGNGIAADSMGKASMLLTRGNYKIIISAIGFEDAFHNITISKDYTLNATLRQRLTTLKTVEVTASQEIYKNQMSIHKLDIALMSKLPVILGEIDPLKTITLLPGIKNGGEAGAGIYVRGGGPDQNLVLLDGIPVYNPNHLLGFFSIFNGDALKNIEVIKGGMPAEYGGRLSSVIAVNTRDGNKDSLKVTGGIGLISSRIAVEGPLVKGRSSFIISGRRTYIDQVAKLVAADTLGNSGYFFYDVNGKLDYQINSRNTLYFTFYAGRDNFRFASNDTSGWNREFKTIWGNTILGLTWKQQLNEKLKQELSLVRNDFNLSSEITYGTAQLLFSSGLTDYQVKNDWTFVSGSKIKWKAGLQYTWHSFRPGAGSSTQGIQEFRSNIRDQYAQEAAAYLSADIDLSPQLNVVAGMRYSYFNQVGPTERVIYGNDGAPTGTTESYKKGESIARYSYPEPRLNILYRLPSSASIKLSYTRTIQYLHLATTSAATFPSDLWVPSGQLIKPGIAVQVAAGYFKELSNGKYEMSVETYYKTMNNQIEFKPGAQLLLNQNMEGEMIFGSGKAYGIELFLQKKTGRLNGWIGYTLSRSERTFPAMNEGKAFPYRYDRTHDLSVVANYKLNRKWDASAVFVYGTGNALTLPTGRFVYNLGFNLREGQPIFTNIDLYSKINDYRMPAYHRFDIAFTYTPKPQSTKRFKSSWVFSLYNVYNRANPFFIYLDVDEDSQQIKGKKVFLFPVLPGITWNFKF